MAGYGRARARIGVPRLKDSNDIHANFLSKQSHNFIATLRSIIIHARVVNTVHSQKFRFLDRIFLLLPLTFTMTTVRERNSVRTKSLNESIAYAIRMIRFVKEKMDARFFGRNVLGERSVTNLIRKIFFLAHDRARGWVRRGIFFSTIKPWRSSNTNEFWIGWMGYYRRVPEFIMHFITKRGFYRTPMGSMNHYFEIFSANEL